MKILRAVILYMIGFALVIYFIEQQDYSPEARESMQSRKVACDITRQIPADCVRADQPEKRRKPK